MEALQREGLTKSIGVSNFSTVSLRILLANCTVRYLNSVDRSSWAR